jgi:hypothetical protein
VSATTVEMSLVSIAEDLIALLAADRYALGPIQAEFPGGASEHTRRAVSENTTSLGFKSSEWERRKARSLAYCRSAQVLVRGR